MLGYLLSGDPAVAFNNISSHIPCRMKAHPFFIARPHRVSKHTRQVPLGKKYPRRFTCHHLLLLFPSLSEQGELPLR
jgi:hypothetical protein